ncbi:MAG: Ig domain-containing protein, partial [Paludibacteraceae bacterium]|nr:Ig domain-containing protein [Paludibacteraceae bacterium]
MKNGYADEVPFTSDDIATKDGKYYLVFGTTDDYKAKAMKYTLENAVPTVAVTGVSVQPTTLELEAGETSTLTATVTPSDASNKKVTWSSNDPAIASVSDVGVVKGEGVGTTKIIVTTVDGSKTAECTVTVKAAAPIPVTAISIADKTVQVGASTSIAITYTPSNANTGKQCDWTSSDNTIATVNNGTVTGLKVGSVTITATSTTDSNIKATCTVTVQEGDPLPPTSLTLHEPGVYEESAASGGYETALTTYDHRLYEVYYCFKGKLDGSSIATAATTPGGSYLTDKNTRALDGWFTASPNSMEESGASAMEEFKAGNGNWKMKGDVFQLHVKGYDLFKILAADNDPANPEKVFHVFLNGKEQTMTYSKNPSTRAFELSPTQEYLIEVKAGSSTQIKFYGFSLREAQIPMVSHLKGNDSTQVVPQTEKIRAITYYTKYNKLGETRVIWEDQPATGIDLIVKSSTEIGDTLQLAGVANCAAGVYPFHISSFDGNGVETKRLPSGKITVTSDIHAIGIPEVEVYEGEAMEELDFSYHALSADDITIDWKGNKPNGIDGHGADGKYYISGTPTQQGDYPFTISVKGGNSVDGFIKVLPPVVGDNLVLYLYTNGDKDAILAKDGVVALLSDQFIFVPRKALSRGLRSDEDYQRYKWVLISEDANATNEEVLALTQRSAILPVLNMKAFSYAEERLSWGDPDNGSLTDNGRYITVQRDDHPIFKALGKKHGDKIQVLTEIDEKGLMPIDINLPGTFCLATSLPRSKTDYYSDGKDPYTFLHDVPAGMRGGKKYICLPIAMSSSKHLTTAGKDLVKAVVNYLLNDEQSLTVPNLQITSFIIDGISGNIDQSKNRITFEIDLKEHFDVDKYAIKPTITLADGTYTHVTPASGEVVDFSESWSYPVAYEVSDYINRRVYEVAIRFFSSEGIEDVYAVGDWVNIYDIFGRKVSTTNEDIYHMV